MKEYVATNFAEFISKKSCLIKFGAEWCGPCKAIKPVLEKVASDMNIDVYDVDIDIHSEVAVNFSIRSVPTVIAFKDGEPIGQMVGAYDESSYKDLAEKIK